MNVRNHLRFCVLLIAGSLLSCVDTVPGCAPPMPGAADCVPLAAQRLRTKRRTPPVPAAAVAGALGAAITVGLVGRAYRRRRARRLRRAGPAGWEGARSAALHTSLIETEASGRRRVRRYDYDRFYRAMTRDL